MEKKEFKMYQTISYNKSVEGEIQLIDGRYVFVISCEGRDFCFDMFSEKSLAAYSVEWFAEKLFYAQASKAALGQLWQEKKKPDVRLFHWYLDKTKSAGKISWYASGIVLGHPELLDSSKLRHSSPIEDLRIDEAMKEVQIETKNTIFHCPLSECDYKRETSYEYLPALKQFREVYEPLQNQYLVEKNSVLLVFSDHAYYYFEYGAFRLDDDVKELLMDVHVGTFQDSCLIYPEGAFLNGNLDIRYFPHPGHIKIYELTYPEQVKLYVENQGDRVLYIDVSSKKRIPLLPGERKLYDTSNAVPTADGPMLMGGDLYPAGILFPAEDEE